MKVLTVVSMTVPSWKIGTFHKMWEKNAIHGHVYIYYKHGCSVVLELSDEDVQEMIQHSDLFMEDVCVSLDKYVTLVNAVKRTVPQNVDEYDDTPMCLCQTDKELLHV